MSKIKGIIKYRTHVQSIILDVFRSRNYIEIDPTEEESYDESDDDDSEEEDEEEDEEEEHLGPMSWDIMWVRTKWVKDHILGDNGSPLKLRREQRINHFPNSYQLTRKDLMFKNLERYQWKLKKVGRSDILDFSPKTFFLPHLWELWKSEFRKQTNVEKAVPIAGKETNSDDDIWIVKPAKGSQGNGIKFVKTLDKADSIYRRSLRTNYVVQKYISNPYLIDGRKFDIRLYVLTLSYKPLVVYVFRGGFCRLSTQIYNPKKLDLDIHLTNISIQSKTANYNPKDGCKIDIKDLRSRLIKDVGEAKTQKLFNDIQMVFLNSLQAAAAEVISDPNCFELYGYDILIDSNLKPWLIEINATPSMEATTEHDYDLKFELLSNVIDLVLMTREMKYDKLPKEYGGFDLVWNKEGIIFDSKSVSNSKIGYDFKIPKASTNPYRSKK